MGTFKKQDGKLQQFPICGFSDIYEKDKKKKKKTAIAKKISINICFQNDTIFDAAAAANIMDALLLLSVV